MFGRTLTHFPLVSTAYKQVLIFASGMSVSIIARNMMWALLAVILTMESGPTVAGWFIGGGTLFQILIAIPLAGYLADRRGALQVQRLHMYSFILGSVIWLLAGDGMTTYLLMGVFYFLGYGLNVGDVYIMRLIDRRGGGTAFGLFTSILSVGYLSASLIFPYFTHSAYPRVPLMLIVGQLVFLISSYLVPADHVVEHQRHSMYALFVTELKEAWHFVKINRGVPVLSLGNALFEGVFYAAIWFLIPVQLAQSSGHGLVDGLSLGIYELVTVLFAGYFGYLADTKDWRYFHAIGRGLLVIGLLAMVRRHDTTALILLGVVIGVGNNLTYTSAQHALEAYDDDHDEDGAFVALREIVLNSGYAVVPILLGMIYAQGGFVASLELVAVSMGCLAVGMLVYAQHISSLSD